MAGFKKAKAEQAALKMGVYGPPGSGKTFTSLLLAEGLGVATGKRVAYIDTERGTDFYCKEVRSRKVHPEAFDFDALYTKSITEALQAVKDLNPNEYGVIVIDSITHIWEAAINAYGGNQTRAGTIPMHAWGKIKKPYKELMTILLSSPMHVIICGRQGTEYSTDSETDQLKAIGVKMKAEGETAYEPHILIRMESIKPTKTNEVAQIVAYAEKDRTGVLSGRSFINPNYESLCSGLLPLLGLTQAKIATNDETAANDSERLSDIDIEFEKTSKGILDELSGKILLCKTKAEVEAVSKTITPSLKSMMLSEHLTEVRAKWKAKESELKD